MWKFFREFLLYLNFVCVLYVISYSNHNLDKYYQVKHLRRLFLNSQNSTHYFLAVRIDNILFLLFNKERIF